MTAAPRRRRWTAEEDRQLVELYESGAPRELIATKLGRTSDAVDYRRRILHRPARRNPPRRWSEREEAFLRAALVAGIPTGEIATRLNRTRYAVRRRRELIGAARPRARRYTVEEDALIRTTLERGESLSVISEQLGRSSGALRLRAKELGLLNVKTRHRWTPAEDDQLRRAYVGGLTTAQIRERLLPGRSAGAIVARAHLLGLAEHGRRWSHEDDTKLARFVALDVSSTYIAGELGRTEESISKRCRLLGLKTPASNPPRRQGRWSAAEDELLRARIDEPLSNLVSALGRSRSSIRRRRRLLELKAPARTLHHPLAAGEPIHARIRLISDSQPLTATRAIAVAKRLRMPLAQVQQLADGRRA